MVICPKCGYENEESARNCANCHVNLKWALEHAEELTTASEEQVKLALRQAKLKQRQASLIITTTYSVEGRAIAQYLDVVTAEVVLGTGFLSELGAGLADFLGARAGKFQDKLRKAKRIALEELREQAVQIDADAVVGVDLDYMTLAANTLMVTANGTAVKLISTSSQVAA